MSNKLELLVAKASSQLSACGLARWWKIPTDLRLIGDGRMVHGSWNPCDFMGFTSTGRSILIEAKMCSRNRLAVGGERTSGLKGHQWSSLKLADRCGAVALIAWMRQDQVAVIPFATAARFLDGRFRSIPWFELEDLRRADSPPGEWFLPHLNRAASSA